jgi:hypothetical protein
MPITTAGLNFLTGAIVSNPATLFNSSNARIGVGDSSTTFNANNTDLQASSNKLRKSMEAGYPQISGNEIVFRSIFSTEEANFNWNEWGIFNSASDGVMLNRVVESLGTKNSNQTWQFTVTLQIVSTP